VELKLYLEILVRRWRIVLLATLGVACLAAIGGRFISPLYEAQAMLRVATPLGGTSIDTNYQTTYAVRLINTYSQIATSDQVKEELKQKLGIKKLPDISTKVIPDSEIIQIIVQSNNPELAAKTANTLVDILISYQDNAAKSSSLNALNSLATRKSEVQAELTEYQQQHDQLVQIYAQTTADMAVLDEKIKLDEQLLVAEVVSTNPATKEIERIEEELDVLYQQYKELSTKSNEALQKINLIRQVIQSTQNAYLNLLSPQYDNVLLAYSKQKGAQNIEIVSSAMEPSTSSSPSRMDILVLGMVFGLVAGIATAFVIENLDTRIFSLERLSNVASIPIVGSIPKYDKRKSKNINNPLSIQRSYWFLGTKVKTLLRDSSIRTIMVTSPNGMEGKSTIVFRLASELARNQLKVLVVDADLRSPQQHKLFDLTANHGLSDFLAGNIENLDEVILKNVRPCLDLLPNLTVSDDPTELLQSSRWKSLLESVKVYDVVLFDTSSLLIFPDALYLVKIVESVLLTALWGNTTSDNIQSLCEQLESVGSRIMGIIVNRIPLKSTVFFD
jgi:non-specific protein-tyrosine kinase